MTARRRTVTACDQKLLQRDENRENQHDTNSRRHGSRNASSDEEHPNQAADGDGHQQDARRPHQEFGKEEGQADRAI